MNTKKPRPLDTNVEIEKVSDGNAKPKQEEHYKYSIKFGTSHNAAPESKTINQPTLKPDQDPESKVEQPPKPRFPIAKYAAALSNLSKKETLTKISHTSRNIAKNCIVAIDKFSNFVVHEHGIGRNEVIQKARSPILFALWVSIITFGVCGLWAGLAPLDKASHAQGIVVSSTKKQIIQHKEGGILESLDVKEGEEVKAGQVLARIEDKGVKSYSENYKLQKIAAEKQLELAKEQLKALEGLYKKGFASRAQVIEGQMREANAMAHLSDISAKAEDFGERAGRQAITAPIDGTITQIQVHTIGGPVHPNTVLMSLTPKDDNLVIEAYVSPADIDLVHVGLKSKIMVSAFKHRSVGYLTGVVTFVSPDVVELDQSRPHTQEGAMLQRGPTYKVRIEVDKEQLKHISKYREYHLYPGMTADVSIVTGERTLLQYLLDPVITTFWHALKEQ